MRNSLVILFILFFPFISIAQNEQDSIQKLDEVTIETRRISLPFSENSYTISVISAEDLNQLTANSLEEILQNSVGIDIRRRGIEGMQSDLYIRGGNFEQVLILIDGVKMDDLQTGHHAMNAIISVENIARIEIIKGAASRIYGQNAMNGAINIVTKKATETSAKATLKAGSFESYGASVGFQKVFDSGSVQISVDKIQSEGYRYNTDFENWNAFFKTEINQFEILATYAERKFGANGFYASPAYKDQYEETQTHLLALKRNFEISQWNFTAQTYWRRNLDDYVFVRTNPNLYHNTHKNNKIGASLDANFESKWGITGLGIDLNQGYLKSNNLGDHDRFSTTFFVEQRFQLLDSKLDITPGFALTYYSDFKSFVYPGIDMGYKFNSHFKIYTNAGYTSRIPTFTNMFYNSPAELGNPDLKPEKAFTAEGGIYYTNSNVLFNLVYFYRNSTDLIDWTKEVATDKWKAENIAEVTTHGIESSLDFKFKLNDLNQKLKLGYTFVNEDFIDQGIAFSRYELNSFKNQFTASIHSQFIKNLDQNIYYRYVNRLSGEKYQVVDASLNVSIKKWQIQLLFNNIFNEDYTETSMFPMPKFNMMSSVSYRF